MTTALSAPRSSTRFRLPFSLGVSGKRLLGVLALLTLWALVSLLPGYPTHLAPTPAAVLQAAWESTQDGRLPSALSVSGARLATGFFIGSLIGISLGLLAGASRQAHDVLDGTLQALRAIPFLALAPMFSLWFSADEAAKIALVAFGASFPLYLSTLAGIRALDPGLLEAAQVHGLTPLARLRDIVLPGASPQLLTGLRIGFTWALAALVAAELTNSVNGIGALIAEAREYVQIDLIFVCIVSYALFGLLADLLLKGLARLLMPWQTPSTRN